MERKKEFVDKLGLKKAHDKVSWVLRSFIGKKVLGQNEEVGQWVV